MERERTTSKGSRRRRQRGVSMVEYMEILILVTLGAAIAMAPLGVYMVRYYDNVEFLTGMPFP